jgi:hypothetical protein
MAIMTVLQRVAGKDASAQFAKYHNPNVLIKYASLKVGSLNTKPQPALPDPTPAPAPAAAAAPSSPEEEPEAHEMYGDIIPYADPNWYQSVSAPWVALACPIINML